MSAGGWTIRAEGSAVSLIAEDTTLGLANARELSRMRTPAHPEIGGNAVRPERRPWRTEPVRGEKGGRLLRFSFRGRPCGH